jgi:hypothetical protein
MSTLVNGQLVRKDGGNGAVFLVLFGQRCGVPSPQTATNLFGGGWNTFVTSVSTDTFNSVVTGTTFPSGSCLVQASGQLQIYLYTWGEKMLIANPTVSTEYLFNTGNVINNLNPQLIEAMPTGPTISN